jgi:hypothetical protein
VKTVEVAAFRLIRFRCDLRFVVDMISVRSVSTSLWRDQETPEGTGHLAR